MQQNSPLGDICGFKSLVDYFNEKVDQDRPYGGPGKDHRDCIGPPESDKTVQGKKAEECQHGQECGIHQKRGHEIPFEQQGNGALQTATRAIDPEYLFADTGQHVFFGEQPEQEGELHG